MPTNRQRIPGPLGLRVALGARDGEDYVYESLALWATGPGPASPGPSPLSDEEIRQILAVATAQPGPSDAMGRAGLSVEKSAFGTPAPTSERGAKGGGVGGDTVGDGPGPPGPPANPWAPTKLNAALRQGVRVYLFRKGAATNKPGEELALPSAAAAAVVAAGVVAPLPFPPGPAILPGGPSTGPLNLPGPFKPNAFAPGSYQPPRAIAPGAEPSPSPVRLPGVGGVVSAGAVILMLGALIPSDSKVEEDDPELRVRLIDKFTRIVHEQNDRLNTETFNKNFRLIKEKEPGLWAAIERLQGPNPWNAFSLLKIAYGRTLETMVAEVVRLDPELNRYFQHIGGAKKPDFYGVKGPLIGLNFDITTFKDIERHKDPEERPTYGENLIVVGYARWFEDSLDK